MGNRMVWMVLVGLVSFKQLSLREYPRIDEPLDGLRQNLRRHAKLKGRQPDDADAWAVDGRERDRAVHRAGVDVGNRQASGEATGRGALPDPRRAVDGHDERNAGGRFAAGHRGRVVRGLRPAGGSVEGRQGL